MDNVRLQSIEVTQFRSISPGTEVSFGGGLNVVLGGNGAGKSTLLRLVAALLTGKLEPIKDEPVHVSCRLTAGPLDLSVTLSNDPSGDLSWSVDLAHGEGSGGYGDICSVSGVDDEATLHIDGFDDDDDGHSLSILSPFDGGSIYEVLYEIASAYAYDEVAGMGELVDRTVEAIRGANEALKRIDQNLGCFGEGLEVFGSITGDHLGEQLGDTTGAWMSIHLKGQEAEMRYATFVPAEIRDALAGKKPEAFAADALHVSSREAPFLRRAAEALGAEEVTLVLPVRERKKDADEGGEVLTCNDLELRVVKGGGEPIAHDQLSYGEKRLFSFLYYAAANPEVMIADDLVGGMAYDGAQAAVAALTGCQAFVSMRDPWLFAFLPRPAEGEDAMTVITCTAQEGEQGTEIAWDTLDETTAAELLAAREAGLDRVAAILQAESLC